MELIKTSTWLLLIAGIVLMVPAIYNWLQTFTKNEPWLLIFYGLFCVVIAGVIILKKPNRK